MTLTVGSGPEPCTLGLWGQRAWGEQAALALLLEPVALPANGEHIAVVKSRSRMAVATTGLFSEGSLALPPRRECHA